MDLRRRRWVLAVFLAVIQLGSDLASGNVVFKVQNKFAGREKKLEDLKAHDRRRHSRFLSAIDLPLGGDSRADSAGLYFTKIGLGTPAKDYYVQVDTGSDVLWVNCAECTTCPKKTDLNIPLSLYDMKQSSSSKSIGCNDEFCSVLTQRTTCEGNSPCDYVVVYGDGSSTKGHFVQDTITLDQVTGDLQTRPVNGTVIFGCGSKQSGQLGQAQSAVDGIMGFGQSNSSIISQLASAGKVKRVFSHCLDNVNGGGIFAIGEVVSPKVKTTAMVPDQAHYNVVLKSIDVDGSVLEVPTDVFDAGANGGTIIDSGTTLAYLPDVVHEALMNKILARQPGLKLHTVQGSFTCFDFTGKVDKDFPNVNFHFDDSLSLKVYPHDYLFTLREDTYCFGWQSGGMQTKDGSQLTLLGDLVLSNKLVLYDLENEVIGWVDHNCTSSIKVKDESGKVYSVGADDLGSASLSTVQTLLTFVLIVIATMHLFSS